MTIDPKWRFIIGLVVTFAISVTQGAIVLTNAIPDAFIKPVVAWCGIIAVMGSAITTTISALGMTNSSRLAGAAAIPEVKAIVTTNAAMADAAGPKVVSS